MSNITEIIKEILIFSKHYDNQPALPSSSEGPKKTMAALEKLSLKITEKIAPELIDGFKIAYSKGAGSYPRVSWISIVPKNKRVSNSPSITTCFSRDGNGVVVGLMAPSNNKMNLKTVLRTNGTTFLNVDGMSELARYNNQFLNPLELYLNNFIEDKYLNHITESLNLFSVNNF